MAAVNKIDSNVTGLAYAEEDSIGAVAAPVWFPLEPNEYGDFGAEVSLLARNPINSGRQRKKGVVVDLDAAADFSMDLTQTNLESILQGFMFADLRRKGEQVVTAVDASGDPDVYEMADTTGFAVNDLVFGKEFTNAGNNAVNKVTAVSAGVSVGVADGQLTTEASPPASATLVVVGHEFAAGDLDVDASGALPKLVTSAKDCTELGLIPGEFIYIGGDGAGQLFANAENNGWARVYSVSANEIVLDKTSFTMVTEASTTETIRLFFGRVLKNESALANQVRRSYQLERQLGAPDDSLPSQIQSEYVVGAVPNELTLNFNTADKLTADMAFVATDRETRTGATGVKSGTRATLTSEDAYNTTSDVARLKMAILDRSSGANPGQLFAYLTEFTISVNNNVSPNKAISVLGAFDLTAGQFEVDGEATAYFSDVTAAAAVRNNSDVTFDVIVAKNNKGIAIDIPLIALGDGQLEVAQDEPIQLPLETAAAADTVFDHTMLMVFFDYLPTVAMPQ
jgi:hypothetical protein